MPILTCCEPSQLQVDDGGSLQHAFRLHFVCVGLPIGRCLLFFKGSVRLHLLLAEREQRAPSPGFTPKHESLGPEAVPYGRALWSAPSEALAGLL